MNPSESLLKSLSELENQNRRDSQSLTMECHAVKILEDELASLKEESTSISSSMSNIHEKLHGIQEEIIKLQTLNREAASSSRALLNYKNESKNAADITIKTISRKEKEWEERFKETSEISKLFNKYRFVYMKEQTSQPQPVIPVIVEIATLFSKRQSSQALEEQLRIKKESMFTNLQELEQMADSLEEKAQA